MKATSKFIRIYLYSLILWSIILLIEFISYIYFNEGDETLYGLVLQFIILLAIAFFIIPLSQNLSHKLNIKYIHFTISFILAAVTTLIFGYVFLDNYDLSTLFSGRDLAGFGLEIGWLIQCAGTTLVIFVNIVYGIVNIIKVNKILEEK